MLSQLSNKKNHSSKVQYEPKSKPLVSVIVPGYNEASIVKRNLASLCDYMSSLKDHYDWELIFINDGSKDATGDLAEAFSETRDNIRVLHHIYNFRLGQALRYAFSHSRGDYIVVIDLDLSYSPDHIGKLLQKIRKCRAKIVVASPYMKGGKVSNVPWLRKILSKWANRFLCLTAGKDNFSDKLTTITGMVRAYDGEFLRNLNLKAMDVDINYEIIYKAMILKSRIVEIPAHLNWSAEKSSKKNTSPRKSSMRIIWSIIQCLISGFLFRPFMFFIFPGLLLLAPSFYTLTLIIRYTYNHLLTLDSTVGSLNYRFGLSLAEAFRISPVSFVVFGFSIIIAIQLISLGLLALQKKRYFEELFHLGSIIKRNIPENRKVFHL